MNKKYFMLVYCICLISNAESGNQTKEETFNYLKDKVSFSDEKGKPKEMYWYKHAYTLNASNEMCNLIYRDDYSYTRVDTGMYNELNEELIIPLRDVNPDTIVTRGITGSTNSYIKRWVVDFRTKDFKKSIKKDKLYNDEVIDVYEGLFHVQSEWDSNKVVKALKHIVILCGGKSDTPELF